MSDLPKHTLTPELALRRGVDQILPNANALANEMQQRSIRLYLGIDPTGNQLHLGHAVVLRKLQQFAELGHEVILLIGNGTVKIGDPTGKDKTRPMITDEEIEANFQTWKEQASTILDFDKITLRRNGEWYDQMNFSELIRLFSNMTVQQLMERDMFQERLKNNAPIHAHEILYPILQGFDSVAMEVDLEIGGTDQIFNMMVGRQMLKSMKDREKWVLAVPLLIGTDGRKMGKSLGNYIALTEAPREMYGKLMSVTDEIITQYFRLLTDVADEVIDDMDVQMANGANPMEFKKQLAFTITADLHDEDAARDAQAYFERTVQQGEVPKNMPAIAVAGQELSVLDLVMATEVPASRSEGRRLIEQGGVSLDDQKLTDPTAEVSLESGSILKVGKRNWFRIK
ncbi:tyrosine--tRNA ligase [Candidatus Woesebacteria bacterium]|nr:tyrosine--tRNA ligase [Candidatus Woesebacteria bacterium]MCD8506861.1 tyrosine--tRNA ligase [Candidatus Woesebacteria bacterium]MCD8527519.1 tyrosine--tRNA ligase [Candidatus Woesebacteria bacterium]MCD8546259.1 tyrosine--tRNA ligase [Candidatus Woesebacteria bacterium]